MDTERVVCVPIDASLYNELVLRLGDPRKDITAIINDQIEFYLERTEDDGKWSAAYHQWRAGAKDVEAFAAKYGDPTRGYQWGSLFLPNGTKLSMNYKGRTYHADVHHEQMSFEGKTYSPSKLARVIANNTNRNAWRDIYVKRPRDNTPVLADDLRRRKDTP